MRSVPQWCLCGDPPLLSVQFPHPTPIEVSPIPLPTTQAGRPGNAHYDACAIVRFDVRVAIAPSVCGIATDRDRIMFGTVGVFWLRWGGLGRQELVGCGSAGVGRRDIAVLGAFLLPFG